MTPYTEAMAASNASAAAAAHTADRICLQYWATSEGLDVIQVERTPEGYGEITQLRTLHLCDRAKALVRGM
jgi:hypothetical protein